MSVATPQPVPPRAAAAQNAMRIVVKARRRSVGISLGALPVTNLVVLELGAAVGLILIAVSTRLLIPAGVVFLLALIFALLRWGGRWATQWTGLTLRYLFRSHARSVALAAPTGATTAEDIDADGNGVITADEDPRVALLGIAVPDLIVAHGTDHEHNPLGMTFQNGIWTAVLAVEAPPELVTSVGAAPNLPLGALAGCLEDRGVVLDSIQAIWHCYPGSAALPTQSPALNSYLELQGPLASAARRTTWIAVRLDPHKCSEAIRERGGGVVGAHRALIGALSRVRNALASRGVRARPLDVDELLRAGVSAAELNAAVGSEGTVKLRERWGGVTAGGVGHASYAITNWPRKAMTQSLNALTGVRALSSTVVMSISPGHDDGEIGLRGLVRVSARTPSELNQADRQLLKTGQRLGVTLTPLRGLQLAGMAATLPLGAPA